MPKKPEKMQKTKRERKGKKNHKGLWITILRIFLGVGGISMLLYPWISNYLYDTRARSEIDSVDKVADSLEEQEKESYLAAAREYNDSLVQGQVQLTDPFIEELMPSSTGNYNELLMYAENGIMGHVEIPAIDIDLPIYHGTSNEVLKKGVGHLEGSSLPIGGESTHTVLTGHTGLSSAKLFTDLTELEIGDWFFITILGDTLAYQVTEIQVVEPEDTDSLRIVEGEDLATLITCTPYGVNDHRLYVTGTRGEYSEEIYEEESTKKSDTGSLWMQKYRNALIAGILIAVVLWIIAVWLISLHNKKKKKKGEDNA